MAGGDIGLEDRDLILEVIRHGSEGAIVDGDGLRVLRGFEELVRFQFLGMRL